MPPPMEAELLVKEQLLIVAVPALKRPPPLREKLLVKEQPLTVAVPALKRPPPTEATAAVVPVLPPVIVRPLNDAATASTSNTRLAWLPLTLSTPAPGPTIFTSLLVIVNWPLVSVMVPLRPGAKSTSLG